MDEEIAKEGIGMFCKTLRIFLINSLFLLFITSLALAEEKAPQGQTKESLIYENEAMGVKITGPQGWYMRQTQHNLPDEKPEKLLGSLVGFTFFPFGSKSMLEDFAWISLETTPVTNLGGSIISTPLEYANHSVQGLKDMNGMMSAPAVKIIEEPVLVKINNLKGARFAYESNTIRGTLRYSEYVFMRGGLFYSLIYTNKAEYFDKHLEEFEEVVNTLVLK